MFNRLELLIGKNNVDLLHQKHILIVGIGGVGGYTLESLVRSGIGKITIIDHDIIDISNLNRQIISNENNLGLNKVDVAKERVLSINSQIIINPINDFLTKDNIIDLLKDKYDFIIDTCDTISTKIALIQYANTFNTRIISCMGTANKMHPELLKISTLDKTSYDPIARILRKEFKTSKIPVVYSEEIPIKNNDGILGSNSFVPGTAGLLITSYVINTLIK